MVKNDRKATAPRRKRVPQVAEEPAPASQPDAIAQIDAFVADVGSHDELARRARSVLALKAPSDQDMHVLVEQWRRERASWGERVAVPKEEEE